MFAAFVTLLCAYDWLETHLNVFLKYYGQMNYNLGVAISKYDHVRLIRSMTSDFDVARLVVDRVLM